MCIAALNGSAVGVGITMTLGMDIRVAAKDAKIGEFFFVFFFWFEMFLFYFFRRILGTKIIFLLLYMCRICVYATRIVSGRLFDDVVAEIGGTNQSVGLVRACCTLN